MNARTCLDCGVPIDHRGPNAVRCKRHGAAHKARLKRARDRARAAKPERKGYLRGYRAHYDRADVRWWLRLPADQRRAIMQWLSGPARTPRESTPAGVTSASERSR